MLTPLQAIEILSLYYEVRITYIQALQLIHIVATEGGSPEHIAKTRGFIHEATQVPI